MTEIEVSKHLRHLHEATNALAETRNVAAGENLVLMSAVLALVATHPDPERFAQALRATWFRLGQPHVGDDTDPQILHGIDDMLANLEEASPVPLKVRPPRT